METLLMSGKPVADAARERIAAKIAAAKANGKQVALAIVTVGDDPASHVYKSRLIKMTESLGAGVKTVELPATASQEEVETVIKELNADGAVTGILPMMPLPKHLNSDAVGALLAPAKDVDCCSPNLLLLVPIALHVPFLSTNKPILPRWF